MLHRYAKQMLRILTSCLATLYGNLKGEKIAFTV